LASAALALQAQNAIVTPHDYQTSVLLRLVIFDCRFSSSSGTAFAFSAKRCVANRVTEEHHAAIARISFDDFTDSFDDSAPADRCTVQESESALDWSGGNGWSRLGHCD